MSYTYLTAETQIYPQCFSEFSKTYFLLSDTSIIAMGVTRLVTIGNKNKKTFVYFWYGICCVPVLPTMAQHLLDAVDVSRWYQRVYDDGGGGLWFRLCVSLGCVAAAVTADQPTVLAKLS